MTAMYTVRRGGAYDRFKMTIESFLEKQWEVHCLSLTPIQIEHSFFRNHVMDFPFKTTNGFIAKLAVLSIFPLWSVWIAWRYKIDLLIAFGSLYAFIQSFAKWLLKKSMVTLIRGSSSFGLKMQNSSQWTLHLNKFIENIGFHFSDRIITNNMAFQEDISRRLERKKDIQIEVLFNDIPSMHISQPEDRLQTRTKYGIPGDAKVIVASGILNRGKNIEILVECLQKIEEKNVYVLIAGDGLTEADLRYKDSLQGLAKKLGVDKKVIFTGWLEKEDLWKLYLASDLFILPSRSEGMPNAMLEALGFDLPCLGSRISGVKDILQYEDLMFDPEDEKGLVEKIHQFFSDEQHSNYIIELCRGRKKEFLFDWKERVFQMVTQRPSHRGEACQSR